MSTNDLNSSQQAYDKIEYNYLVTWCRFHSEEALDAGIEDYAGEISSFNDESVGIQIVLNEKCLTALDEIDFTQLDTVRQTNYQILHGHAELEHHNLMEHDWRYRDPSRYLPINAIHQLTIRPINQFDTVLKQRLDAIPDHIRDAKNYITARPELIPNVWLITAMEELNSGIAYFHQLCHLPQVKQSLDNDDQLEQSIANAANSLDTFSRSLHRIKDKCNGNFACGRRHFDRLLKQKHFLPINAQQLHHFGQQLFSKTKQDLEQALANSALSLEEIQQQHPTSEQLLTSYKQEMQAAADFLNKHNLITLPNQQTLKVVTTPTFLQHQIPFAAYLAPSSQDLTQTAYYYVTPIKNHEELKHHNLAAISQTSVHEAWPGHHLQFVTANQSHNGCSLLRRLTPCATLYEGWALYCEQMMLEQGFKRYSGQHIIMLQDRLWRALRIIIDVELHTQTLTFDEAVQKMIDILGFSKQQAEAEIKWYSQSPTIPMSYAVGWALINALRDIVNPIDNNELSVFHDKLLAAGSIALPLVIQSQFGHAIWQKCCQHVFGEIK